MFKFLFINKLRFWIVLLAATLFYENFCHADNAKNIKKSLSKADMLKSHSKTTNSVQNNS